MHWKPGFYTFAVEYGITQNVSAKFEYLYITAASLDVSHHNEIRAGLNYRFGGL